MMRSLTGAEFPVFGSPMTARLALASKVTHLLAVSFARERAA